jgi:hypothetical protein
LDFILLELANGCALERVTAKIILLIIKVNPLSVFRKKYYHTGPNALTPDHV